MSSVNLKKLAVGMRTIEDLEMRLKFSENIPWYAALFGGIPALAGGFVLENIIDERVDDASTFKFNITGSIDDPKIIRLN